uniref:Uncharacterized protein n=1 Tax=viral metagenome TaxID=1070528 RepID=A0A6M3JYQ1_9ZZZZ
MKLGDYNLEIDRECKCIADGWEIFGDAVAEHGISPEDFAAAHWEGRSIIVEKD